MSDQNRDKSAYVTGIMIDNANGLRIIAEMIEREGQAALDQGNMSIFTGSFQAAPILWALGIEIALKAWICRETDCNRPMHCPMFSPSNFL